jgi:hypothetical protein
MSSTLKKFTIKVGPEIEMERGKAVGGHGGEKTEMCKLTEARAAGTNTICLKKA